MSVKIQFRRGLAALLLSATAMVTINLPSAAQDERVGEMPAHTAQSSAIQKLGVSIGDDLAKVREVFAAQIEVQPYHSGANLNASTLRLRTKGVWFFFDQGGRITTIRLDAPFGDDIAGLRIKDRRDALVQTRGEPIRKWQAGANEAYLYPLDDLANARYDINKAGEIETIFLVPAATRSPVPSTTAQAVGDQEAPPTPALPKPVNVTRFVPSSEERTIGTVTALNPDCSSRGPVVARVVEKPAHGDVSFENGDIFPNYVQTSPLFACNSKRMPGLMISYRSEQDFIGQDNMKVFLIFPDGSGAQWNYMLIVK